MIGRLYLVVCWRYGLDSFALHYLSLYTDHNSEADVHFIAI